MLELSIGEIVNFTPEVNSANEFVEISSDYWKSEEIVREGISNAFDWGATYLKIRFDRINGQLVIKLSDDGSGMTLRRVMSFWNLGDSLSKEDYTKIGEKGHGTKVFLMSSKVELLTQSNEGRYKCVCENPKEKLLAGEMHEVVISQEEKIGDETFTEITIYGYDNNEGSQFTQKYLKDYIYWFTKLGSVEKEFVGQPIQVQTEEINDDEDIDNDTEEIDCESIEELEESIESQEERIELSGENFKVKLKALDSKKYEVLDFGHKFANQNSNLEQLKMRYGKEAPKYYVKKYTFIENSTTYPDITYNLVVNIEGDQAKREYNKMIVKKGNKKNMGYGKYKVQDRYGLWLTKNSIPIERKNEWVSGFGNGSNSIVLVHGFLDCEGFRLTANRGGVAMSERIEAELKAFVKEKMDYIDSDLRANGLWKLIKDNEEEFSINKTKELETDDYTTRVQKINSSQYIHFNRCVCYENGNNEMVTVSIPPIKVPDNESELSLVASNISTIYPDKLNYQLLDYNTYRGIDNIVKDTGDVPVSQSDKKYMELKHILDRKTEFNHTFRNLKYILCWDFDEDLLHGCTMKSKIRECRTVNFVLNNENGINKYYLEKIGENPIEIIRLKEFIINNLGLVIR